MQIPSPPRQFPDYPGGDGSVRPADDADHAAQSAGLMKAMSPGVVDFLFRQLVAGRSAEDVQWQEEGITLAAQPVGSELARRLAESDVEALTPTELFHYVRAAQRLAAWAEGLREAAVERYCLPGKLRHKTLQADRPLADDPPAESPPPANLRRGP